jgi:hypothetical protein
VAKSEREVPEGAAVFPTIPAELGVDPLLLAVLHATVFLAGSDDDLVQPDAAVEALESMADYLRRLAGPKLARVREDLDCLIRFARQQRWADDLVQFLQTVLANYGIGEEGEA